MPQSTLKATLKDLLWDQDQARQSSFIAAEEAAQAHAEAVATIAGQYDFARDEMNCFFTAQGAPVQLAMTLTEKDIRRVRTVITRIDAGGSWLWFVENMAGCQHEAGDLIAAVQQRVGAKLTAHLTGRAN